jgi:hypothetical protein
MLNVYRPNCAFCNFVGFHNAVLRPTAPRSSHAVVAAQTETADGNIIRFLNYSHEHIEIESAAKLIKRKLASQTWRETQLSYLVFPRRLVSNGRSMKSG